MVAPARKRHLSVGCHGLRQGVKEIGGEDGRTDVTFYFYFVRVTIGLSHRLPHECLHHSRMDRTMDQVVTSAPSLTTHALLVSWVNSSYLITSSWRLHTSYVRCSQPVVAIVGVTVFLHPATSLQHLLSCSLQTPHSGSHNRGPPGCLYLLPQYPSLLPLLLTEHQLLPLGMLLRLFSSGHPPQGPVGSQWIGAT